MTHAAHYHATTHDMLVRLRKIEGQIRGLDHMIQRGDHCTDVLTQIAAARAALAAVGLALLDRELQRTVGAATTGIDIPVDDLLTGVERLTNL